MSVIKRDNYEEFFINYLDGNLSKKEVDELLSFLMANPDLKEEFDELEKGFLIPEEVSYVGKISLKKQSLFGNLESDNFNELCIANIENNLSPADQNEFNLMIEDNSELKKQYLLFEKTILSPDLSIVFEKKSLLKKAVFIHSQRKLYNYISIAASIILVITLSFFIPKSLQKNDSINDSLSSVKPIKTENLTKVQVQNQQVTAKTAENKTTIISERQPLNNTEAIVEKIAAQEILTPDITRENIQPLETAISAINASPLEFPQIKYTATPQPINNLYIADNTNSQSIKDYLVRKVKKNVIKKDSNKNKIDSWDVAEFAINGVNKIAGTNMSLNKKLDAEGKVKEIEFNSRLIAFTAPVKE